MVRTYKEDEYNLLSPWEKSMQKADATMSLGGSHHGVGIRTFKKHSVSPIVNANDYNVLKLPPITEDPQQTIEFLGEEVGKVFIRSKRKLKTVKNEFTLYDPYEKGRIPKTAAYEILKRYKLPPNDNYQRKILSFFVVDDEPGKVDRIKLMDFLENSKLQYKKYMEAKAKEEEGGLKPPITPKADSTHGRYDTHTTHAPRDPSISPRRGEAVTRQFADRRDVGLSLEIEKAFKASGMDPHEMIEKLEASIQRSTVNPRQRDLKLVNNMHLKGLVAKHHFPINAALTMRCIERLDPYGNGEIEWPKFIEFLRKAVSSIPPFREPRSPSTRLPTTSSTTLSSHTAPWERSKPLGSIGHHHSNGGYPLTTDTGYLDAANLHSDPIVPPIHDLLDETQHNIYPTDDYNNNPTTTPSDPFTTSTTNQWDAFELPSTTLNNNSNNNSNNNTLNTSQDLLGGEHSIFQHEPQSVIEDEKEEKLQTLSTRGEVYKRVADALNDRAMLNNGLISTNDVRKTVNYYNMLFDANINLQKIIQRLDKHSKSDYVNVDFIIDSFSKGIV